jgi:hypothetical protein
MKQFAALGGTLVPDGDAMLAYWPKGCAEAREVMRRLKLHHQTVRQVLIAEAWNRVPRCAHCGGARGCLCLGCLNEESEPAGVCAACGGFGVGKELVY